MSFVDSQESTISLGRLVSATLSEQALTRIQTAIIRGELAPGSRLDEVMLARSFGISRAPLREALRRLEERKLIQRKPRTGVTVVSLTTEDVTQTFMIREALEGMAARLAAENMSDAEIAALEATSEALARSQVLRDGGIYDPDVGDFDFHLEIASGSHNDRLRELLSNDLLYLMCLYRGQARIRAVARGEAALEQHHAVVEAIKARRGDDAEQAMRRHVADARRTFVEIWKKHES